MRILKNLFLKFIRLCGYDIVTYDENKIQFPLLPPVPSHTLNSNSLKARKVHYGCGPIHLKGWLNVDIEPRKHAGFQLAMVDLTKKHPFLDGQFKFGFSEDFFEHLSQADQIFFLCEVFSTFKKGGVLRLSFPGLEGVIKKHYRKCDYETISLAKHDAYDSLGHLHFPGKNELRYICKHIGFEKVDFVRVGESIHKPLRNLDSRLGQELLNTYVEITK
jgi:predicted SAM-dependent methyltransferase